MKACETIFSRTCSFVSKYNPALLTHAVPYLLILPDLKNPKTNRKNAGFTDEERSGMTELLGDGFVDTYRHKNPDKAGAYTFWTYMMNSRAKNTGWLVSKLPFNVTLRFDLIETDRERN